MHLPLQLYTTKHLLKTGGFVRRRVPGGVVRGMFNWRAPDDETVLVAEIRISFFNIEYFASEDVQIVDSTDYKATFKGELRELLALTQTYHKPLKLTALAALLEALRNNTIETLQSRVHPGEPLRYWECLELAESGLSLDILKQFANSSASYKDFKHRDPELPFSLWLSLYSSSVY
jgi:hypothetical protein